MNPIENYIFLSFCKRESYYREFIVEKKSSWHIYYDKTEKCFVFRNLSGEKYTKTRNIENFFKIWIADNLQDAASSNSSYRVEEAKIDLYLQQQLYSVCSISHGDKEAPIDTALRYASILKDII